MMVMDAQTTATITVVELKQAAVIVMTMTVMGLQTPQTAIALRMWEDIAVTLYAAEMKQHR